MKTGHRVNATPPQLVLRFAVVIGLSVVNAAATNVDASATRHDILDAIGEVESGGRDEAIGRAGERSRFQMTAAVWRQHTALPFHLASEDPGHARRVALAHVEWLVRQISRRGLTPTPHRLALAWNGGLGALTRPRRATVDFAERVVNLVQTAITTSAAGPGNRTNRTPEPRMTPARDTRARARFHPNQS